MRLQIRLTKLAASVPRCNGRISRVVVGEYQFSEANRCRLCGGCHVLVMKKQIVTARTDMAATRTRPECRASK
jgi:hypothetical protein